jgi:multimeric flavodoxin WrbA
MRRILAIYGSPRRRGNTALLLGEAVAGAREAGAQVEEVVLRDLKISPCLEIYGCRRGGQCALQDDFQPLKERMLAADALMIASPVFFYAVSAHLKILMDRCQSLWVKKHWIAAAQPAHAAAPRKVLFISVGATGGRRLFEGVLLSMRYFLETLDAVLWRALLYRGIDLEGEIQRHPDHLAEAREGGRQLAERCARSAEAPQRG